MTETVSSSVEHAAPAAAEPTRRQPRRGSHPRKPATPAASRPVREVLPVLAQLAQLYPALFGANALPLKRGIYQDLLAAHGEVLDKAGLKEALAIHTRSTRYLLAVANGTARYDLQGNEVEPIAPEHVFHAVVGVFKRKKPRDGEDLQAKLRHRIGQAFVRSGLSREAYMAVVQVRDAATQTALEEALNEVAEQDAKAEAVERAYVASGSGDVRAFADMYGMDARLVIRQLQRAKQLRAA